MSSEEGSVVAVTNGNGTAESDKTKFAEVFNACKSLNYAKTRKKVAIFTHGVPDLDAIGCQVGIRHLLSAAYGVEADCFVDGDTSHPQNKAAVLLLDPHLQDVEKYCSEEYFMHIVVDTVPSNAGTGDNKIVFDLVIDHHKDLPGDDFGGTCIHHHCGSCSAIVYGLIEAHGVKFNDEIEQDIKVATALAVGVITDTEYCTKADTTHRDFHANQALFKCSDLTSVRKIVHFRWPMSWVKLMGTAVSDHIVHDGTIAVAGLGLLDMDQYDAVGAIADWMLTWGSIHTAVVFACFDGNCISGSVRTIDNIEINQFCEELGGKNGKGGGKNLAGRYFKPLGDFSFGHDEDKAILDRWWQLQKEREMAKIFKVFKK